MDVKTAATIDLAKTLRSFRSGSATADELLGQVRSLLDAGAAPDALLDTLKRQELSDPLPPPALAAVMELLQSAGRGSTEEAATIVLDEMDAFDDGDATPGAAAPPPLAAGDVLLDRFCLLELIGHGGMSRVYKAIDVSRTDDAPQTQGAVSESLVAVKVLNQAFTEDTGRFAELRDAVEKLRGLDHPHIIRMFDSHRDGAMAFITMEFLAGSSLYTRLRLHAADGSRRGFAPDTAPAVIDAVAAALEYAHGRKVIHGDLKPGNVLVGVQGDVKVIDFGMTGWTAKTRTTVTPRYASPQLMARQRPEVTDDVYALACLAYELLTGTHPFAVTPESRDRSIVPPLRPGLTRPQYAAVVNGLKRDRRQRTATIGQFMTEFRTAERPAAPPSVGKTAGIALLLIALAGGAWYALHSPRPEAASTAAPVEVPIPPPPPQSAAAPPAPAEAASGTTFRDCPLCPLMTQLPAGRFTQGSPHTAGSSSAYEQPAHEVTLAHPPAFAADAVTVGDFREFIRATRRDMRGCDVYDGQWRHRATATWKQPGFSQNDRHPVTCVSWNDATVYAQWLSTKTSHRYRLPSAAEWEYAARGGQEPRPWDTRGNDACAHANVADQSAAERYPGWTVFACDDGFVHTAPVGSFQANGFQLNDMLGNVFQWTQDCWHADYVGAPADGKARMDGDCSEHELRGGSWFSSPAYVRSAYRNHFAADYRTSSVGFRLVRETDP